MKNVSLHFIHITDSFLVGSGNEYHLKQGGSGGHCDMVETEKYKTVWKAGVTYNSKTRNAQGRTAKKAPMRNGNRMQILNGRA